MTRPAVPLWNVRVDFRSVTLNEADAGELLAELATLRPVLVVEEQEPHHPTLYSLTVHVYEASMRQAIAVALRRVEDATGTKALGVEALPQHEVERRLQRPNVPQLVGNADIAEILGVSRQRAAQLADVAGFPPPVMTIKAGPLRVRDQVEDWARTWDRKAGRPAVTRRENTI